jgi:PAS domain S-box-containing protein
MDPSMKILYVEDNKSDVDLTIRTLQLLAPDIQAETAYTLAEALLKLKDHPDYDLVLSDLRLPDGNGLDVLDEIRQRNLPLAVVILTGFGDEETAVLALKSGANDYVVKREDYLSGLPIILNSALERYRSEKKFKSRNIRILYAEHHQADIDLTLRHLASHASHIQMDVVQSWDEFIKKLRDVEQFPFSYDVILLDYRITGTNGLEMLKVLKVELRLDLPVVLITGQGSEDVAVQALRLGAADYLVKNPGYLYGLPATLENVYNTSRFEQEHALLKESEERYKNIFDNNHAVMIIIDPDTGMIVDANPAAKAYYGWNQSVWSKKSIAEIDPLPAEKVDKIIQEALSQEHQQFHIKHRLADGTLRDVEMYSGPVKIKGNTYLFSIIHDITDRKLVEKQLREAQELLSKAIENAAIGMTLITPEGHFHQVNKAFCEMTGYSQAALLQKRYQDISSPEDFKLNRQIISDVLQEKLTSGSFENRLIRRDGKNIDTVVNASLISDDQGNPQYFFTQINDVTRLKKLEQEQALIIDRLRQSQKMESIGTLAGGIAHDFNNILSIILGFAEISIDTVEDTNPVKEDLKEIQKAGLRAKELTRQILTFARKTEVKLKPNQISLMVSEALKMLRSSLPTTIEIRQNIQSNALVVSDATQIQQIIMNLCTNAAHAMEKKGGILEVTLDEINYDPVKSGVIENLKKGKYLQLRVSDSGEGIHPDILDMIFEPYFTTKDVGEGTGLGLSVVHGIIKSYGGAITAESEEGNGSVFASYFPILKSREHTINPTHICGDLPGGNEHILFVDDEASITKIGSRILESFGYKVKQCHSGPEALKLFESDPNYFDLVITDLTMPKMTGKELAAELIKMRPGIPVILLTGYGNAMSKEDAAELGIREFAMKPIEKNKLVKAIRRILDETGISS